jgi:hypothetical protein
MAGFVVAAVPTATPAVAQAALTCATMGAAFSVALGPGPFAFGANVNLVAGQIITVTHNGTTAFNFFVGAPLVYTSANPGGTFVYMVPSTGVFPTSKDGTAGGGGATIGVSCADPVAPPQPPDRPILPAGAQVIFGTGDPADREPARYRGMMDALMLIVGGVIPSELIAAERGAGGGSGNSQLGQYAPLQQSPIDPGVDAISRFFDFGGDAISGSIPLQSTNPDWSFNLMFDGAIIDRTFNALGRRTWVGTGTVTAAYRLDDETVIGGSLLFGGATSTFSGLTATLDTTRVGADLAVVRMLTPTLRGGLFGGAEYDLHKATIAGVSSTFHSSVLKLGGVLEGQIVLDAFTLTPAVTALVQYRQRPAFTDGAGVAFGAADTLDADVLGGATLSRDFVLTESGVVVSPYLTVNGWLDHQSTTPAAFADPIPTDTFKVQAVGGLRFAWEGGAAASISADISGGATTMMYGATARLTVPIK